MFFFTIILLVCLTISLAIHYGLRQEFSIGKMAISNFAALVIAGVATLVVKDSLFRDVEILNGVVTSKSRETVACIHLYECNCYTSYDSKGNPTRRCSTCYEHTNDYDWNVYTTVGTVEISRIDSQGTLEPPRFTSAYVGEPVAREHDYYNYVKAAPGTLFKLQGNLGKYEKDLPTYPEVFDYYKIERVKLIGDVPHSVITDFSDELSKLNSRIGSLKQVNVFMVVTKDRTHDWFYALREKWVGGKKNDVIIVVNIDDSLKPTWVDIMSWSESNIVNIKLRDDIMNVSKLEANQIVKIIEDDVTLHYTRKPFEKFSYLSNTVKPSTLCWILSLIICCVTMICFEIYIYHKFNFNIRTDSFGRVYNRKIHNNRNRMFR